MLADKILANHLVTVYARSGLGKTSLLQAGVAPLLREEGYLPLFVRVNDLRIGPFRALLETVPGEAARQHIEYVPGRLESLWSFFKTAEFWRDDLLLTPVLILDQFEELFTLQSEEARAHFLNELSYLIRGVRPPPGEETPPGENLSEHPPPLRIVLSLREDCLGLLEDAAEHIPQILDARFRLAPLDLGAAREAIVRPAAVTDPGLETTPFAVDPTAVDAILAYLSHARTPVVGQHQRYVEPFQLQLICRRMEEIAATRQKTSGRPDHHDGGPRRRSRARQDVAGLLRRSDRQPAGWRDRRSSRRLCEKHLISTEGRRLSLEEHEIHRQLNLTRETLGRLVAARLLRSENRSHSTYYELSHDALVEPILAASRYKARAMAMLGIGYGALLILISGIPRRSPCLCSSESCRRGPDKDAGDRIRWLAIGVTLLLLPIVVAPAAQLRGSARSWRRYRRSREPAMTGPEMRSSAAASPTSEMNHRTIAASSGGTPPQGWYPSPDGPGLTWWNGQQWTGHRSS